jgi:hypothetical protein
VAIRVRLKPIVKKTPVTPVWLSQEVAEDLKRHSNSALENTVPILQRIGEKDVSEFELTSTQLGQEYILEPVEVSPPDLELDDDVDQRLTLLSQEIGLSKEKLLRSGITLIEMALQAKKEGLKFGAVTPDQPLVSEVVGL